MNFHDMVQELMWNYDCSKQIAERTIESYSVQNRYQELVNIVKFKRSTPEFIVEVKA